MKKLFLTSSFVDVYSLFENFVNEPLNGKTVTFIPTASIPEKYKGYVENDRSAFEKLGIKTEVLEISEATMEVIKETIERNDFIFISGGNTFFLLQELKKSGADKIISEEINKGKLYIGASAGSIIMSPNIEYIEKMDKKSKAEQLTQYDALHMVDFYPLPHFTNEPFKKIVEEIIEDYDDKIQLVKFSNTQAIQIIGNEMEIVGER